MPRGSGTKLGWGAPPRRCDLVIDTLRLDRVVEHEAGDLVVRVQAGVTIAPAGRSAGRRPASSWPWTCRPGRTASGSPTVGGVLATGAAGPRRLRYGTARDLLIGVTVVRADGTVAKSGGKVVKNVAGYDLGKLFTGSLRDARADHRGHRSGCTRCPPRRAFVTAGCAGPDGGRAGGRGAPRAPSSRRPPSRSTGPPGRA